MKPTVQQDRIVVLLLAVSSSVLILWLTSAWPSSTHDGLIHMHRIRALADGLRAGVLYPRWFPDYSFGYGYPLLNYYPPLFYYPSALLNLAGLDMVQSVRLPIVIGFTLSAWWMYRLARLFFSVWPAVLCVFCYLFHPYRMIDLFERGAFPEFTAFIWLPLIASYGFQAVVARPQRIGARRIEQKFHERGCRPFYKPLAMAGLAFACLILTHTLTAVMTVFVLLVVFATWGLLQHRAGIVPLISTGLTVAAFAVVGILLTSWFTIPVLFEMNWVLVGKGHSLGTWMDYMAGWRDLFEPSIIYSYRYSDQPTFFLPIYSIPIGIAAIYVALAAKGGELRLFTIVTLVSTILAAWLTTSSSFFLWENAEIVLEKLQFPWRWQLFIAFGTPLVLAACIEYAIRTQSMTPTTVHFSLSILATYISIYPIIGLDYPTGNGSREQDFSSQSLRYLNAQYWQFDEEGERIGHWHQQFLPVWFQADQRLLGGILWEQAPLPDSNEAMAVVPTRAGLLRHEFQVSTKKTFRLLIHQFYFPSWRVWLDGRQARVEPAGQLSLASVEIPPGTHDIVFSWSPTPSVWFGRLLTCLGWIVAFVMLYVEPKGLAKRRSGGRVILLSYGRPWILGGWLAIGALMAIAASGITDRTWEISEIGADWGNIRLEGVRPPSPIRSGEVAAVQLWWSVKTEGVPVSAFVHLVDETGMGVSQHDGPPGGQYTPYPRWVPGLVLNSIHYISIPETLSPGTYRLIAGLYFPDLSQKPLVPLNGDNARLEVGTLEVLPK